MAVSGLSATHNSTARFNPLSSHQSGWLRSGYPESPADSNHDSSMSGDQSIFAGYAGSMLIVSSIGWSMIQISRRTLPALLPSISEELAITPTAAGLLLTVLSATYAVMQYPSGRFSDRFSRKGPLIVGLILSLLGCLLLWSANGYEVLFGGVLILGLGAGIYPTSARALVADLFDVRRGEAFGIHTALGDIGSAVAAGVALAALSLAVWRSAFVPTAIGLGAIAVVIHVTSRETYQIGSFALGFQETFETLLDNSSIRWVLVAYALYVVAIEGVIGFLPALIQLEKGMTPTMASFGYAMFFISGIIARPFAGRLSDRFSRGPIAGVAMMVAAGGLLLTVYAASPLTLTLSVVILAFGTKSFPPVMQAHLMDLFSEKSAGADLGATRTMYIGVGSLGPTYVGVLSTHFDYATAFLGLVACLILSAIIILWFIFEDSE